MMIKYLFFVATTLTLSAGNQIAFGADALLPDLISTDELSEEFGLPKAQELFLEDGFSAMSLDDHSSANGLDLTQHFKVVVLVNKATQGPNAQTAQIFFEGQPYKTFTVSTGRERLEKAKSGKVYRTVTPVGWFRPILFSPNHYSKTWKARMPWAVFFNGGIALHATSSDHYAELGKRASGGCVRLRHENAKELYHLIKGAGKAMVPKFTSSGKILRDENNAPILEENYDTLIIVENSGR